MNSREYTMYTFSIASQKDLSELDTWLNCYDFAGFDAPVDSIEEPAVEFPSPDEINDWISDLVQR
jgi:hypothetical protein